MNTDAVRVVIGFILTGLGAASIAYFGLPYMLQAPGGSELFTTLGIHHAEIASQWFGVACLFGLPLLGARVIGFDTSSPTHH